MGRYGLERRFRRVATVMLMLSLSAATGAGLASWAVGDTTAFYMNPIAEYGTRAYARDQPVADSFWKRQERAAPAPTDQAPTVSTATSAQPTYRSASGS